MSDQGAVFQDRRWITIMKFITDYKCKVYMKVDLKVKLYLDNNLIWAL